MKTIITLFISMCIVLAAKSQTGELQGRVFDAGTNEGIPFTPIVLMSDGMQEGIGQTDEAGNFIIRPLTPGSYDLRIQYIGYRDVLLTNITIVAYRISFQNVLMNYDDGNGNTSAQVPGRDVNCTPVRSNAMNQNVTAVSVSTYSIGCISGAVTQSDNTPLIVESSREIETVYYMDGCRIRGSMIPVTNVEDISIITGGIPARYENAFCDPEEFRNSIPTHALAFRLTGVR